MFYGLIFTIYGLIFTVILLITVFMKKRKLLIRQKLYRGLIFDSLLLSIVEIISILVLGFSNNFNIFVVSWQIRYFFLFFYVFLFIAYYYSYIKGDQSNNFSEFIKDKLIIKVLLFLFILLPILYIVLFDVEYMDLSNIQFARGFVTYVIVGSGLLFSFISIIILLKDKNKNKKLLSAVGLFMTIFLIAGPLQVIFYYISLFPFVTSLILYTLYYNLENPDIELLEDVAKLKSDIDKSSNTKTDFLFNLSYDLINPMNTIVSLSDSICSMDVFDESRVRNDAKRIKFAGNALLDSIDNILDMSNDNTSTALKEYNLFELVSRMKSICEARIGAKQVKFEMDIDNNLYSKYVGDVNKIQKILMNVLGNAVKFTDVGKIKFSISSSINGNSNFLDFKVFDTGCGIKEEEKSFVYSDSDVSSGVGLAVSKRYVEEMGGIIRFESTFGGGTTFFISIPQNPSGSKLISEDMSYVKSDKIEYHNLSNNKVLIVDDDNLDIKVTKRLLQRYNLQIEICMSTIEFVEKIKREEVYDIVFLDHKMPEMDGVETVSVLRTLDGYNLPKLVSLTANASGNAKEYYKSVGFDDYLSKPIDKFELDRVINKFIQK